MSLYPTPVSVADLKTYMRLADNADGISALLTDCLETATERVYSYCNWDWTRKLTAHPDPTNATYDQYNRRWIQFMGDGRSEKRVNFSIGLVRQCYRRDPHSSVPSESFHIGNGAGMAVPQAILSVTGEQRNIIAGVDGFVFERGYEYELELIYQLQDDATNRNHTIPDTVLMAITQHATKLYRESGHGTSSLGHAEETGAFGQRVKFIDLEEQVQRMLHPFRQLPV